AYRSILLREHPRGKTEPPLPAPGNGAIRDARETWYRPFRFRLARHPCSGRLVKDHHRTAERYAPHLARVSLAELVTSSKYPFASCGWNCASAAVAAPSSTNRNSTFRSYRVCAVIFPSARAYYRMET